MSTYRHCAPCNAPRQGETCWKCGAETKAPASGWEYPRLPPVDRIRELARQVGYAIGEHGSKERDLDLIAAPWTDDAVGNFALMYHIARGLSGRLVDVEEKPLGRVGCTIQMNGWFKLIDLSVMPGGSGGQELITGNSPLPEPAGAAGQEQQP
ncbi:MAG TPA: hypothetical protein VFA75_17955 [Nevskia sp.]|nr:hypothetical protein [Nevskia sp.]